MQLIDLTTLASILFELLLLLLLYDFNLVITGKVMAIHQSCDVGTWWWHNQMEVDLMNIWYLINPQRVFDEWIVFVQKPESRNSRGSIDREDGALQTPVSSQNSLLVFVSSQREICSATARTQSASHFLVEPQPVMPITRGHNLPKQLKSADPELFPELIHLPKGWNRGIWSPERRSNRRRVN